MKIKIGDRFGRLTIVGITKVQKTNRIRTVCECSCDCGGESVTRIYNLTNGSAKSCGCLQKEGMSQRSFRHGEHEETLYRKRASMIARCEQVNSSGYCNYGARGIYICEEWRNSYTSFRDWALNNGYKKELTIDRIDVNGPYSPENCRWIPFKENNRNSVWVEAWGENKTLDDWADDDRCQITRGAIARRLKRGWNAEDAISAPSYVLPNGDPSPHNPWKNIVKR